ncbi:hypothetical protein C8J35_11610 [Rhizobium sp. PP-F2F-G38]|nr:hypothetical protein C8J35_11610 [Rhizobium sp. PP-F2F-G38]
MGGLRLVPMSEQPKKQFWASVLARDIISLAGSVLFRVQATPSLEARMPYALSRETASKVHRLRRVWQYCRLAGSLVFGSTT